MYVIHETVLINWLVITAIDIYDDRCFSLECKHTLQGLKKESKFNPQLSNNLNCNFKWWQMELICVQKHSVHGLKTAFPSPRSSITDVVSLWQVPVKDAQCASRFKINALAGEKLTQLSFGLQILAPTWIRTQRQNYATFWKEKYIEFCFLVWNKTARK